MGIAIVWGQKQSTSFVGFAADYCEVCREIRPFALFQVVSTSHVYWIPFGQSRPVCAMAACTACEVSKPVEFRQFAAVVSSLDENLDALVGKTNPQAYAIRDEDRRCAAMAVQGTLPDDVKSRCLSQPFQLLAPIVESLHSRGRTGKLTVKDAVTLFSPVQIIDTAPKGGELSLGATMCILSAFLLPLAMLITGSYVAGDGNPMPLAFGIGAAATFAACILGAVVSQRSRRRRVLRSKAIPLLAHSLRPFKPTRREVEAVMAVYEGHGYRIGRAIPAEVLMESMRA